MSEIKKMFIQSSHYFNGRLFIMIAHLLSFPILTRVLSISDYGILGLVTIFMLVVVSLGKAGIQN